MSTPKPWREEQGPADELDYECKFATWLSGDTIASATVTVPTGLLEVQPPTITSTSVTGWLKGGTRGQTYLVLFNIVTAAGRKKTIELYLKIR